MENINNIQNIEQYDENSKHSPLFKIIFIVLLSSIFGVYVGYASKILLYNIKGFVLISPIISLVIASIFFFSIFDISAMIVNESNWFAYFLTSLFPSIGIMVGLFPNLNLETIIGVIAMFLFLLWGCIESKRYIDSVIKIKFFVISKNIINKSVIGFAILLAILFFDVFSIMPSRGANILFPQALFEKSAEKFSSIAKPIIGNVDLSKSLNQMAKDFVNNAMLQQGITLNESTKKTMENKFIKSFNDRMSNIIKSPINANEPLSTAIYNAILNKFNNLNPSIKRLLIASFSFLLFISVEMLAPFIRFISGGIAFILFEFLLALGFIKINYKSVNKEELSIH